MPEYIYICSEGHECTVEEEMNNKDEHICFICNEKMWRKPQMPAVNWGGLKPSQGELAYSIQDMVDNEDENRDNYLERKETT